MDNNGSHNMSIPVGPGVYKITCKKTGHLYIGESQNIAKRVGGHLHLLKKNSHPLKSLQVDWNKFGEDAFTFEVIATGPKYSDKLTRTALEDKLIQTNAAITYNIARNPMKKNQIVNPSSPTISHDEIQFPVLINGVYYYSIREIARVYPHSRDFIKELLLRAKDLPPGTDLKWSAPQRPVEEQEKMRHDHATEQARPPVYSGTFMYKGKVYHSMIEASNDTGNSRSTIYRALHNPDKTDSYYMDNEGKQISEEYYEKNIARNTSFRIENKYYSNVQEVMSAYKINKTTVYRRCASNNPMFASWLITQDIKPQSPQTQDKAPQSDNKSLYYTLNERRVSLNGRPFSSITRAAEVLKITPSEIFDNIKNPHINSWFFLDSN